MSDKINCIKFGALLIGLNIFGCKGQGHSKSHVNKDSLIVNCYVMKPVFADSKAESPGVFDFSKETLNDFLGKVVGSKVMKYDSAMDFVTSFGYQKELILNYNCFSKLTKPDSSVLINIYFNSAFATWVKKESAVQFIKTYRKAILSLGNVTVFEYKLNNVAEIEPHFMYLILKDQTEDEKRYGKDYMGFVVCSDGMDWKDFNKAGISVPLFIKMIRRSKELYIPLYYDGKRFIPVGHFRSNNWEE